MQHNINQTARMGGVAAIIAALTMITGAILWGISGADIDAALAADDMAGYITAVAETRPWLLANLCVWIVGVMIWGMAATAMSMLGQQRPLVAHLARYCYWVGVPIVTVAYVAWLSVVVHVGDDTSASTVLVAEIVGWVASRADWVATILIVGIGPTFLSVAGRGVWVPTWLFRWSLLTAFTGLLNAIAMLTGGAGLTTYGFLIIPVGVFWMLAAGIVLVRYARTVASDDAA